MEPSPHLHTESSGAAASSGTLPQGPLSAFSRASGWLNSLPLAAAALSGRVVLVQFWTYTCINWLRTLPYLRAWARRYASAGLVVIGVHTPEFDVECDAGNVRRAAEDLGVRYPVALDNDYAIWDAFGNRFWPALYLIGADGRIEHHHFGEGDEERSESILQRLLTRAGARGVGTTPTVVRPGGVEAPADWTDVKSWETYLGYEVLNGAVRQRCCRPVSLGEQHAESLEQRVGRAHRSGSRRRADGLRDLPGCRSGRAASG